MTQGAVKWKDSDLFRALKVYCILVKYDGKFVKRPRTELKLETVFSNHSNRTLCFCFETRYPACWGQLETYHQFGTVVPWWLQMPSKFYTLAISSVLNGYLGASQKGFIFFKIAKKQTKTKQSKPPKLDICYILGELPYISCYFLSRRIYSTLCFYSCSKILSSLVYIYSLYS